MKVAGEMYLHSFEFIQECKCKSTNSMNHHAIAGEAGNVPRAPTYSEIHKIPILIVQTLNTPHFKYEICQNINLILNSI